MVGVSGDEKYVQDFDRENEMKRSLARIVTHGWKQLKWTIKKSMWTTLSWLS
jgi:hypothetical protein